jgi:hypothetical protein
MNAADCERLRSWAIKIAGALLPDAKQRVEGSEVRFIGHSGLTINGNTGAWYCHGLGRGGWSTLPLISLLGKYSAAEAADWASRWLKKYPGFGPVIGEHDDTAGDPSSRISAEVILRDGGEISGTPAERYLRDERRIDLPYPADLKYLANARCGEGGLVAPLYSHGRVTGVHITYLDPHGRKSVVLPQRRRFNLEKAVDAVFLLPHTGNNPDVFIAEGFEDSLSVWRYGALRCQVIGLPGIGVLRHLRFPAGTKVTVLADGDPPDSPAAKALQAGLDALLLAECECVLLPFRPLGWMLIEF